MRLSVYDQSARHAHCTSVRALALSFGMSFFLDGAVTCQGKAQSRAAFMAGCSERVGIWGNWQSKNSRLRQKSSFNFLAGGDPGEGL